MSGDGNWADCVIVVVSCSSEADAFESTVDIVAWRKVVEDRKENKLFRDVVWEGKKALCDGEEKGEPGDPRNEAADE